jgi:hypothetical protein
MKLNHLSWQPWLALFAAILVLSVLLNFEYPANHFFSWGLILPSIDVVLLLGFLAVVACFAKRSVLWTTLGIWALFLFLRLIRIGDTVVPMYLERPFNLYIDSGYLYGLYDLLKTTSRDGNFVLLAAGVTMVTLGMCTVSWYAWKSAAKAFADARIRMSFLGGSGLTLCALLISGWQPSEPLALVRLWQELYSIHRQVAQQESFVTQLEQIAQDRKAEPASLSGLGGADVLLLYIESYGRVVFSRPQYQQEMKVTLDRFDKVLAQHGFEAVSSFLSSPTYGGSSWLAHATLESGVRVGNDLEQAALLRSSLLPIASLFRKNGYRTVSVMPGIRFAFPQGSYFDYDQAYYAWNFDYQGPDFGWASMPDQFALDLVRRREFLTRDKPIFARYVLISSHAAFNIQPPYIDDWETLGNGSLYKDLEPVTFPVYWNSLKEAGQAYLRSLDYDFTVIGDYLARYVTADSLIIILGDHQPPTELTGPGEPWSVPVHIISRNPRLLDPFRKRGYTTGVFPAQPLPHAGMETFAPLFLEDFK